MSEKRNRTLTFKGVNMFEEKIIDYNKRLKKAWDSVCYITEKQLSDLQATRLASVENELTVELDKYETVLNTYCGYLSSINTTESKAILEDVVKVKELRLIKVQKFRDELIECKQVQPRMSIFSSVRSRPSTHSRSSHSVSSSVAVRAKAEAARTRAVYAEREAVLRKKQTLLEEQDYVQKAQVVRQTKDIDIDLELLQEQKEAAALEAEVTVLELANSEHGSLPAFENSIAKVEAFTASNEHEHTHRNTLNELAPPFQHHSPDKLITRESVSNEMVKFLVKKELLLTRLTTFSDKPELYLAWKVSFCSVMEEIEVTPAEEVDLLIKWLGTESKRHALSIRAANIQNMNKCRMRIWDRLEERFGAVELIEHSLKTRLEKFRRILPSEMENLYDLTDILSEIEALKENEKYSAILAYYDTSSGLIPIVQKLPHQIQEKWTTRAASYKLSRGVPFPPFSYFCSFMREISKVKNDPCFKYNIDVTSKSTYMYQRNPMKSTERSVTVRKTDVNTPSCVLHSNSKHNTLNCRIFTAMSYEQKRNVVKENYLCFRCLSAQHKIGDCKEKVLCTDCGGKHMTVMHNGSFRNTKRNVSGEMSNRQSTDTDARGQQNVNSKCTQVCGSLTYKGKSCAKFAYVYAYRNDNPRHKMKIYALIDDQSNRTLASTELFDTLGHYGNINEYTISSCNGTRVSSGRSASGLVIESILNLETIEINNVLECNDIPNNRDEIPTPAVAENHKHLWDIRDQIAPLDEDAHIHLLIGRDVLEVHQVYDQRVGMRNSPYAQHLKLGWVIIGEACIGEVHKTNIVNVNKSTVLVSGRPSVLEPCPNCLKVEETYKSITVLDPDQDKLFRKTKDDDKPGPSKEDLEFIEIMDNAMVKSESGQWAAPLPFKSPTCELPNNRQVAMLCAKVLDRNLQNDSLKREHFVKFMGNILEKGHAEIAPKLQEGEPCWYLPIFGVYHPKKPGEIRGVFDASAKFQDISLNDALLTGPDLGNSLLGVLLRFRRNAVAIVADIQQMFYNFLVTEEHRNFLRFMWYRDNDPNQELIEYRMTVHVFGNSPSPAVTTYGLRKTAEMSEKEFGTDVKGFVNNDFYVDDGLTSTATTYGAIDLLKRTQQALYANGKLKLHKIASNRLEVMNAFPQEDLAKDLSNLDLCQENLPLQRTLGLLWDLKSDTLTYRISEDDKPLTRRGVLSIINSIYDPIGFCAPVLITGKLILRELVSEKKDWDDPLPPAILVKWESWSKSLKALDQVRISRQYLSTSISEATDLELHVYSDASEVAIAATAYIVSPSEKSTAFVFGKAKVAPNTCHTIPRLELCAAVLAVQVSEVVCDQLGQIFSSMKFYTDSKVVLGYVYNKSRRFYTYVTNRVAIICNSSKPEQWSYIPTHLNPADCATRGVSSFDLQNCDWLTGPNRLVQTINPNTYPVINSDDDREIRSAATVLATTVKPVILSTQRFERFSSWKGLVRAIDYLKRAISQTEKSVNSIKDSENVIIKSVQKECYLSEYECLSAGKPIPRSSSILALNPYIDETGVLRVGGRLERSTLTNEEKHPLIIPNKHHISLLLTRHYHEIVKHQGRQLTEGALRSYGVWIVGAKRLVSSVIHVCVKCRKLRGTQEQQIMSDLPADRVEPSPPFTYVGVEVFGPWNIVTRKTRGGQANSKRWAVLFTCLTIRAIHIEVIENMSSSAFINALRRFVSIRGNVKHFRSDRGTNFVGATSDMGIDAINVEDNNIGKFLQEKTVKWLFNPPHASHMGGVWERMIGVARRILDSMLTDVSSKTLTPDILVTFMSEVCAIINARPIVPVGVNSDNPEILSPTTLLTQKFDNSTPIFNQLDIKDIYKAEWKSVQVLADRFWTRWKVEYLPLLQSRPKWKTETPNLRNGDIVLLKDADSARNRWPLGIIKKVFVSDDKKVRKISVKISRNGKSTIFVRPITEVVLLLKKE